MEKRKYICEICGKTEITTPENAFEEGWDYPPFMGTYGIVSPRICPKCSFWGTAWEAIVLQNKSYAELSDKQKEAVKRILGEPENMIVDE